MAVEEEFVLIREEADVKLPEKQERPVEVVEEGIAGDLNDDGKEKEIDVCKT